MPIYEYDGKHYDIDTTDVAAAKAKILSYIGSQKPTAPASAPARPAPAPAESRPLVGTMPLEEDVVETPQEFKTYTSVLEEAARLPSAEVFDPVEAEKLSRRAYAEQAAGKLPFGRRYREVGPIPPEQQRPRTFSEVNFDTWAALLQGGAGYVKGILENIPGNIMPGTETLEAVDQGLERLKTPQLRSSQLQRQATIESARQFAGETGAARAAFQTMFTPAGADVIAKGGGSIIPSLGMSLMGLGLKSISAANALSNAGDAASQSVEQLKQLSPQQWSKDGTYRSLREKGLSHKDAVAMMAPIYAFPSQLVGGATGYVAGTTGLEKALTRGATRGTRAAAGRAGAEVLGEEFESLTPQFVNNLVTGTLDPRVAATAGLGQTAVDTAFGSVPGAAMAMLPSKRKNALDAYAQANGFADAQDLIRKKAPTQGRKAVEDELIDALDKEADAMEARDEPPEGAPDVGQPVTPADRAGVSVAERPGEAEPAAGVAGAEPTGVVPAGADVTRPAAGEGAEPGAVTEPDFSSSHPFAEINVPQKTPLFKYVTGLSKPLDYFYNTLYSKPVDDFQGDLRAYRYSIDDANSLLAFLQARLANWNHPALTGATPTQQAKARAEATGEDRELLNLPSQIAGTGARIATQALALHKGYKGKKAGSQEKINAARNELDKDYMRAYKLLYDRNLLTDEEAADWEASQEREAIQAEPTITAPEPEAATAPAPAVTEKRTKDEFGNVATEVTLPNGSVHTIQRLNAAESMGLPGWHLAGATATDIREGAFLGNTKEEAIQELIRREQARPPAQAEEPPQRKEVEKPAPSADLNTPLDPSDSTTPPPAEDKPYYGSEEINALGDRIKDAVNTITSDFMVGDMVRYGNQSGVVVGVDDTHVKIHPDGAKNAKAYYRVPKRGVQLIARPDTTSKTAAMAKPGEDKKFGVEQGKLNADMGGLIQLLGANMYASSVADVAVKELLQNAFDAVKGAVSDVNGAGKKITPLYKSGEITITFDSEERTITVTDNARGMTPEIVRNAFFTVAGSDKSDVPVNQRSGGLGLAKMGFMLGSERLILDTVRDGVRVRVDTTAKDIADSKFQIIKSPAQKGEHGTSVTVKIPEYYVDPKTGDQKKIYFFSSADYVEPLQKPLIGPVQVKVIEKQSFGNDETVLPVGLSFPANNYVQFKVNFNWGTADIYFAKDRNTSSSSYSIKHQVLSSGVFQFDTEFKLNDEKIPYDIIVNVKPDVEAKHPDYPFENSRERFKGRLKEDIASLSTYLAQIALGNEAQDLQENFKNIVSMPRVDVGQDVAGITNKLQKSFDKRGTGERRELPPMPREVRIDGTQVISVDTGKILADREAKKKEKFVEGSFQPETAAPEMDDFLLKMEQDPKQPIFHNNTNVDLLEVGRPYGEPEKFFAELGTLMVEMKEALADSGFYKYDQLKPENLFFGGVSVDKSYGGVHIKTPYKAVLINPFYDFGAKTLFGAREYLWETMTHEIAHTGDMGHGVGHNTHMLKVRQYLADQGLADYFRDALMEMLTKHESTFTAMREAYGRSTTKNTAKSLSDYEKGAASASDGSAASRDPDTVQPLPAGRGPRGDGVIRAAGPIDGTSGIPRAAGSTAPASVKGLSQDVVAAINRNDIGGALRAIARNTTGFYSELAQRLAELDLPTSIVFNNERALVKQAIDNRTAQQQIRLFAYLNRVAPKFYDQYFKDYDKVENLERVAEGLAKIDSAGIDTSPVNTELATVQDTYRKAMVGLTAPGFFDPGMDVINIRPDAKFGSDNRVILHEIVHAATEYMLYGRVGSLTTEQMQAVIDLRNMYDYAQTKLPPGEYGFTNLSEFVAEAMTNPKFQAKLKSVPYPPRKESIFNSLMRFIAKMIGMGNLAGAAMSAINDIMSPLRPASVKPSPLRFAPPRKRVRGPISKPDSWRTAEKVETDLKDVIADAARGRAPLDAALKDLAEALWSASGTGVRAVILPVLQLRQLKDLTRTKFPQITGAVDIVEKMVSYRGSKIKLAEDIVQKWSAAQSKKPKQSSLMSRIMMEATIRSRDPDKGVPSGATADALDNAWNSLDPEFKQIYREVRDFYADSVKEMVRVMKERTLGLPKAQRQEALRKINEQFGPGKLVAPYFPLRRFGNRWFQIGKGIDKEFYTFSNSIGRNLAFNKRRRQLLAGNARQRAAAETMRMGNGISELYSQNIATTQVLRDIESTIDSLTATDVPGVKAEIKDSLNQLIYILLPQQSMRKMFINRRAIQGASSDMLRVFAHTAVHSAYQQARFKYAEPFVNNITNAREHIDDMEASKAVSPQRGAVYRDYVLELERRTKNVLGIEDKSPLAQIAGAITSTTFFFMLTAPASALLNILGMTALTMPYIGGRYGYAKTNALMLKNMGRYTMTLPTRSLSPLVQGNFGQVSFPSIVEGGKLPPLLQRAADRFVNDGDINISMTNDIFELGEQPSALYTGKTNAVKKLLAGIFHQAERLNREIAMLTTFELAYDKYLNADRKNIRGVVERDPATNRPLKYTSDEAFELAIQEARDIAGLTLGDFTRQMKGRIFTIPSINVITQFKQYAITATYILLRNLYLSVGAPFRKGEIEQFRQQMISDGLPQTVIDQRLDEAEQYRKQVYREGQKRLAGILGMTFLYGGIAAQPFFSTGIGTIIKMFAPDDDDEFFDWENWFYNYMETEVGGAAASIFEKMGMEAAKSETAGRKLGEAIARGPVSAVTGTSLSDRVSLDLKNLWWREGRYSPDARESIQQDVVANLGPSVGLALNWADAWQLAGNGQFQRAFEKAAPALFAKPVTAYRLGTEGATTPSGNVIGQLYSDQFTLWELSMQAIGLQPERLAQAQKAGVQAKTYERKVLDRRTALLNRLWMERGTPGYADILEKANEFSLKYPEVAIDGDKIAKSFDARAEAQAQAEAIGTKLDKQLLGRTAPMLRYGVD